MSLADFELQGQFELAVEGPDPLAEPAFWFVFREGRLLVDRSGAEWLPPKIRRLPLLGVPTESPHYLGRLNGVHCYCVSALSDDLPPKHEYVDLRGLFGRMPQDLYLIAGRAVQIVAWDRDHRFCGRCGSDLAMVQSDRAKKCPQCGLRQFPRLSPAIMALVCRDDHVLLARGVNFPTGFFSVLAGFVEPGETLECCLRREVMEEVGLEVGDLDYFGSQPWPFPNSLMIAFTCHHVAGEIQVDGKEILEADWFRYDRLPPCPGDMSIAGKMIQSFVARCQKS